MLLIAMLALARKFIIIDVTTLGADKLAALAIVILALGAVYWLVRESDQRQQQGLESYRRSILMRMQYH